MSEGIGTGPCLVRGLSIHRGGTVYSMVAMIAFCRAAYTVHFDVRSLIRSRPLTVEPPARDTIGSAAPFLRASAGRSKFRLQPRNSYFYCVVYLFNFA